MSIKVETTFTLSRFDTFERLDEVVNKFLKEHKIISCSFFNHSCEKCKGNIGYSIIYEEKSTAVNGEAKRG